MKNVASFEVHWLLKLCKSNRCNANFNQHKCTTCSW